MSSQETSRTRHCDCGGCDNSLEAHSTLACAIFDTSSIHSKKQHIVRNRLRTRVRRSVARSPTIQTMPSSAASNAGQSCRSSVVAEVICDEAHENVQVSVVSQLSSFTFFSSQICDRVEVVYHDLSHPSKISSDSALSLLCRRQPAYFSCQAQASTFMLPKHSGSPPTSDRPA